MAPDVPTKTQRSAHVHEAPQKSQQAEHLSASARAYMPRVCGQQATLAKTQPGFAPLQNVSKNADNL
eukprot:2159681-Prymnesium_polylepis.1